MQQVALPPPVQQPGATNARDRFLRRLQQQSPAVQPDASLLGQPGNVPAPLQLADLTNVPLLQRDPRYAYENVSRRKVQQYQLPEPRREAWPTRRIFQNLIDPELSFQARAEEALAAPNLRPGDRARLTNDLAVSRQTSSRAQQRLKNLGLEGTQAELEGYRVQYLRGEQQRAQYRVNLGKRLIGETSKTPLDTEQMTSYGSGEGYGVFVLSPSGEFYVGEHRIQRFHHTSFLAGGEVRAAGEVKIQKGKLLEITNKSGHYKPTEEHTLALLDHLASNGVPLRGVRLGLIAPRPGDLHNMNWVPDAQQWREQKHKQLVQRQAQ